MDALVMVWHEIEVHRVLYAHQHVLPFSKPNHVQTHEGATVAALAQGDAGVLPVLLHVVGLAWAAGITDRCMAVL